MSAAVNYPTQHMGQQIDIIRKPRLNIIASLAELTLAQLNAIQAGFRNNIMWNLGHMVAAQCGIWYKRAGLPLPAGVTEEFFETYKPGTKPERLYTADDLATINELLLSTLDTFEADLKTDKYANYATWTTRYGVDITSIDDALIQQTCRVFFYLPHDITEKIK